MTPDCQKSAGAEDDVITQIIINKNVLNASIGKIVLEFLRVKASAGLRVSGNFGVKVGSTKQINSKADKRVSGV